MSTPKRTGRCPGNGSRDVCVHFCDRTCLVGGQPLGPADGWPPETLVALLMPNAVAWQHRPRWRVVERHGMPEDTEALYLVSTVHRRTGEASYGLFKLGPFGESLCWVDMHAVDEEALRPMQMVPRRTDRWIPLNEILDMVAGFRETAA